MADREMRGGHQHVPDTVDMLKDVLQRAGFMVVSAFYLGDRPRVAQSQRLPDDESPESDRLRHRAPLRQNWAFLQHLRATILDGYQFVLTSTNVRYVESLVGRDERVYEVVGKPHDLDAIVRAAKEAARARPTS